MATRTRNPNTLSYAPHPPLFADDVFLAGQKAPAGTYFQIGGLREIRLDEEDVLPASLDGQVAVYVRQSHRWADIQRQPKVSRA